MLFRSLTTATCLAAALAAPPALAGTEEDLMSLYMTQTVADWVKDPAVIAAIRAQNVVTAALSQADIDALDQKWRAEAEAGSGPTIDPVVTNSASEILRKHMAESDGVVAEIFVMDARGLNVAAAAPTSDYWQGDESKFSETFPKGPGTIFVDDLELDQSTGQIQGQVSMTITDPDSGKPIGAVTVGMMAESLM